MKLERRYRRFRLDPDGLLALLQGVPGPVGRPLPPDARWITWAWDADAQMIECVVHSAAFDPVQPDRAVPYSFNGPILPESP